MPASQAHGLAFEQHIVAEVERRLGPATEVARSLPNDPTARFDLPAWRDPTGVGIPTSLKMAKRPRRKNGSSGRVRVDLADARRIVALGELPCLRLLVGIYSQVGGEKVVDEVREYIIPGQLWNEAAGEVPEVMIRRFHNALKKGSKEEARAQAREWKAKVAQHFPGYIQWAAKVDSTQRRLQCSLYLDDLDSLMGTCEEAKVNVYLQDESSAGIWGSPELKLPLRIPSPPRIRHKKKPASV